MDSMYPLQLDRLVLEFVIAAQVLITTIAITHFGFLIVELLIIMAPAIMVTIKLFAMVEAMLEVVVGQAHLHALIQILNFLLRKSRSSYFFLS